jgi:hypothetical protein
MSRILVLLGVFCCGGCNSGRAVEGDGSTVRRDGSSLPACGDTKVMQRFSACMAAKSKSACEQAGGSWTRVGLSPEPGCSCPTGQDGCTCKRSTECLGSCTTPMPKMWDCSHAKQGTCASRSPLVGCRCWFGTDGKVQGICVD